MLRQWFEETWLQILALDQLAVRPEPTAPPPPAFVNREQENVSQGQWQRLYGVMHLKNWALKMFQVCLSPPETEAQREEVTCPRSYSKLRQRGDGFWPSVLLSLLHNQEAASSVARWRVFAGQWLPGSVKGRRMRVRQKGTPNCCTLESV